MIKAYLKASMIFGTKGYCSTSISLMHYAMPEWPKSRHGSIHLHGHQHNGFEYNMQMKEQEIKSMM